MDSNSSESPISQPPLSAKGHGLPSPTATSTTSPKHPAPQEHVNLRSCITCRRRKVRCDKKHPCSNCTRAHIPCSFPKPGRAPRKKRSDEVNSREIELLSRLRRLEGVVESLSGQVDSDKHNESNGNGEILRKASGSGMEQEFGRLMIGKGKTRYVNSSFWSSLNDEVDELPTGADNPSDSEGETEEEESIGTTPNSNQSWLFSFSSLAIDMQGFHPKPEKVRFLWETFIENVHPVTNLFHVPTMSKKIEHAIKDPASTDSGMEAFLFALYHAAITSMTADECLKVMGDEKSNLLTYYKFTIEQALARAGLLVTQELITLQAFTLYLICVRRHDATRYVWSLTGLAIRIAYALGLHRDGTLFALSPYETEMRRRVFWQIVILDVRASEDHGADPAIMEPTFDTKLPLNINDSDISPEDTAFPKERLGYSEMIFSLIRFEVTQTLRRLNYTPPGTCSNIKTPMSSASIADKEGWIEECHERIESKYLRHGNMKEPLFWVTATVARLVMAKMWLILHHPFHNRADKVNLSQETKDKLFDTSIEIIEYASMLETERTSRIWGWVFKTYVQWHAVAFLLTELCHRTEGPNVERAWKAAEASWSAWQEKLSPKKRTILWRPMRRLMSRAKHIREAELARRGASEYSRRTAPVEPAPIDTSAAPLIPEFIPSATSSLPSQQGELPAPFSQAPLIDPTATPSTLSSLMSNDAYKPYRDQQSDFDASPEAIEAMEAMEGDWTNWGDFDTMVRDFQVQMDEEGANERGPVLGSIGQWY